MFAFDLYYHLATQVQIPAQHKHLQQIVKFNSFLDLQVPLLLGIPGTEARLEVSGGKEVVAGLDSCLADSDFDYRYRDIEIFLL